MSFHTVRGLKNHGPSTKHELTKVCVSLPEVTSAGGSEGIEVVHNVQGVIDDEPLDGVLEVRRQHLLAVSYLFRLRVLPFCFKGDLPDFSRQTGSPKY